ncbi:hypothetical protein XBKB1_4140064 [Xenorhabdus bovienii str. kraussei Becker Underwood]|uniref:Uncharacterized protein n=1 Tax=Xenorhabdus bovienii str. kraussei Becker Underwood TaxID=1398204 RepID=A0A077PY87_XENBV|nr:hypothetical protein XBKB1_4140064 [Xenorhabdus bovienii str. kraussei Becker Underwood]
MQVMGLNLAMMAFRLLVNSEAAMHREHQTFRKKCADFDGKKTETVRKTQQKVICLR